MWDWNLSAGWWVGMGFMMLFMLLFWGAIIFLIIWGIRKLTEHRDTTSFAERRSPLDVAKERYARGEISKEQFEQFKKDLS